MENGLQIMKNNPQTRFTSLHNLHLMLVFFASFNSCHTWYHAPLFRANAFHTINLCLMDIGLGDRMNWHFIHASSSGKAELFSVVHQNNDFDRFWLRLIFITLGPSNLTSLINSIWSFIHWKKQKKQTNVLNKIYWHFKDTKQIVSTFKSSAFPPLCFRQSQRGRVRTITAPSERMLTTSLAACLSNLNF